MDGRWRLKCGRSWRPRRVGVRPRRLGSRPPVISGARISSCPSDRSRALSTSRDLPRHERLDRALARSTGTPRLAPVQGEHRLRRADGDHDRGSAATALLRFPPDVDRADSDLPCRQLLGGVDAVLPFVVRPRSSTQPFAPDVRRSGRPISVEDGMIAGICRARGIALATRNVRAFDAVGVRLLVDLAVGSTEATPAQELPAARPGSGRPPAPGRPRRAGRPCRRSSHPARSGRAVGDLEGVEQQCHAIATIMLRENAVIAM